MGGCSAKRKNGFVVVTYLGLVKNCQSRTVLTSPKKQNHAHDEGFIISRTEAFPTEVAPPWSWSNHSRREIALACWGGCNKEDNSIGTLGGASNLRRNGSTAGGISCCIRFL